MCINNIQCIYIYQTHDFSSSNPSIMENVKLNKYRFITDTMTRRNKQVASLFQGFFWLTQQINAFHFNQNGRFKKKRCICIYFLNLNR